MSSIFRKSSLFLTLVVCSFHIQAQEVITAFAVEYKVEGSNAAVNKEDGDFMSYSFTGASMSMILINKMVDLKMVYNDAEGVGLLLNSMQMGSVKVAVKLTAQDLEYEKEQLRIEPISGTKRIAGYLCQGAIIHAKDKSIEVWYSTKLKPHDFYFEGYYFSELEGFPLLIIETNKAGILTSKATKVVVKNLPDNLFDTTIPEGYKLTTFEVMNGGGKK